MGHIKYNHSTTGAIDSNVSNSGLKHMLVFGAIAYGAKDKLVDNKFCYQEYPTDKEGLEEVILLSGQLLMFLNDATRVLGQVLVFSNKKELGDDIELLGWLISGLSDLAATITNQRDIMQDTLDFLNKHPDI